MSQARITFDSAIQDAEVLLEHFDAANTQPPPENTEVLKRAGLVMAFTAWETYVEDLVQEIVDARLTRAKDEQLAGLVLSKLKSDLKRFHNPNGEKTRKLFLDYLSLDVTKAWRWGGYEPESAFAKLDELLSKRGDAVHRAKPLQAGAPAPHLVKREDLEKAIRFLKHLVDATERAVVDEVAPEG
ncbi:HEPN domain-containing protein [Wenzhouxiangella sp. EGI_FJ10305]|uniref:HEPN domain-containing protein n=1 Tax=Wenzhouxiangella sp. EGI_FJ10305 TaxID=3243768 RepID=UPI0035DD2DF3